MNRREYLVVLAALTSGCGLLDSEPGPMTETPTPTRTETPTPTRAPETPTETPTGKYETVVDLVEEGADPTGEKRIDPLLEEFEGSDTKLKLPEGRYRIGKQVFSDVDTFALIGENATLVPDRAGSNILLSFKRVSNLLLEGLTVDQTASDRCGWIDVRCVGGKNLVRDITLDGFIDIVERTNGFTLLCEGETTELVLDDIDLEDGARNGAGIYVFPQRSFFDSTRKPGSITIKECRMKGWGKEGLYASPHGGPLSVLGGRFENNAIVQIRGGGGDADSETLIRDTTVVVDDPPDYIATTDNGNFRGIWLEEGDKATVEGCAVEIKNTGKGHSQGGIIVNNQFGRADIRETTITTNENVPAINIQSPATEFTPDSMPSLDGLPQSWEVTCTDIEINGSSQAGAAVHLWDRDNCVFENVSVDQSNGTRHGLLSLQSKATEIRGGRWVTAGYPIMLGSRDRPSSTVDLLCLRNPEALESTRFDGTALHTDVSASSEGTICIPSTLLPDGEEGLRVPYVGITRVDGDGIFGYPVFARLDGSNIVRQA